MTDCKHCDECNKKPVSFWELCDSGECIPDALLMSPPVCWSCGDNCEHKLKYLTLNWLKAQLDFTDTLVKAHPWDPCAWTLADKLDLSDDCFEWTLDQTHATCPWWKWKLRLKDNCIKTSLIQLTDGPWTYANCNIVAWTEDTDCWCPLTTCPAWVLVSKCDGSGWERQCPNQTCANNTIETNYDWHNKNTQIFWYSLNNNWISWPQFLCPKKKFIAKVKRDTLQQFNTIELSDWSTDNIIVYNSLPNTEWKVITNMLQAVGGFQFYDLADIWWTNIWTSWNQSTVAITIPHDWWYEVWMSGSCLTNRWIHTIRHQIIKWKIDGTSWFFSVPMPLLDFRMEWTVFKKEFISDDNFIWQDSLNDINRFDDDFPFLSNTLRMEAWLWRSIRWHWFWQTTIEYLNKNDMLFFAFKVQTFPVSEEIWITEWKVAYLWDGPTWTNWAWAWVQWFVRELDEYWALMESDAQTYTTV